MKTTSVRNFAIAVAATLAAACGGSAVDGAADPRFTAATPTYDLTALSVADDDAAQPGTAQQTDDTQAVTSDPCHPHLFSRTREVVQRLNRHTWKMFDRLSDAVARHPKAKNGSEHVWEHEGVDAERRFTLTKQADGSYAFKLELAPKGTTNFVTVASGTRADTTSATKVETTAATMMFDFDALHSVVSTERARGQVTVDVTRTKDPSKPAPGVKKVEEISFNKFLPEEGDPHGPRTGSYTWTGIPGVGGSMTFQDSLVLLCPSNPNGLVADVNAVSRWYKSGTAIHGRSDAKATGGQIATGDTFSGVSCHNGEAPTEATENGYWMMKLEDATGATVQGSAHETTDSSAPACDAAFGKVPLLANSSQDYDFTSAVTFPGAW